VPLPSSGYGSIDSADEKASLGRKCYERFSIISVFCQSVTLALGSMPILKPPRRHLDFRSFKFLKPLVDVYYHRSGESESKEE
jgi:hypothetical protein